MANPPAGSTPIYHLRWPGGPDPAEGPTGLKNLATDTEAALSAVSANPQVPAAVIAGGPIGLFAAGTPVSVVPWGAVSSSPGTPFVTTTGNTIRFTRAGLYLVNVFLRAVMDSPSTGPQYVQLQGTGALAGWDAIAQFGLSALADVVRLGITRVVPASIGNAAADATITAHVWAGPANGQITVGQTSIVRLGD